MIKITPKNLTSLKFANSEKLLVGDFVVAIGNPFGIGQTVTSGIVSALGRSGLGIEAYENFIQTDASINPGNSGGALVNLKGELVGINTAIIGSRGSSGSVGIGLAIPVNMALDVTQQLLKYGEVKRGYLGVSAQDLTGDLSKAFGINTIRGSIITRVQNNSPAEKAGIKVGDVVTKINNEPIENTAAMRNKIGLLKVNSTISMQINRKGKIINTSVKILERKISKQSGIKINTSVMPFIIRGVKLWGIDSSGSSIKRREFIWNEAAKLIDFAKLDSFTKELSFTELLETYPKLLKGEFFGRAIVNPNK